LIIFIAKSGHLSSVTEGLERFGNWIENKATEFDELKDMPGSGQGISLFKKLINKDFEVVIFTLLSMGGVDVLGGWSFHNLVLKLGGKSSGDEEMIDTGSKPDVTPDFELQQEGMAAFEKLFNGEFGLTIPFYWKSISL
jgi:hypothetical protein